MLLFQKGVRSNKQSNTPAERLLVVSSPFMNVFSVCNVNKNTCAQKKQHSIFRKSLTNFTKMSNFWKEVFYAFGTYDLYDIFGLDKNDNEFEAKLIIAHRRISRRLHPAKSSIFGAIYKILSDKDSRALLENGGKVDGNYTVQLDLQDLNRPIRMFLRTDSHGTKRHHFLQAFQLYFNSEDRYVFINRFFFFPFSKPNKFEDQFQFFINFPFIFKQCTSFFITENSINGFKTNLMIIFISLLIINLISAFSSTFPIFSKRV